MKIVDFKHSNIIIAKNQPQYQPLPALKLDTPEGEVISCWKLSFWERISVLFLGRVWVSLMTFNRPVQPQYIAVNRKRVFSHPEDKVLDKKVFVVGSVVYIITFFVMYYFFPKDIPWILYLILCIIAIFVCFLYSRRIPYKKNI